MRRILSEGHPARVQLANRQADHAVVVGGSIAGMLAARVLLDHFRRVTIVERDVLPPAPVARRGAPQAQHNHVLLLRGRQVMEELFPHLQPAIVSDGGLVVDMPRELAWHTPWGLGVRFASPLLMLACSRTLLEWRIRQLLAEWPGLAFVSSTAVTGLVVNGERVTGVRTDAGQLEGDLVIDASGRGSHAARWLEDAGCRRPRETVVNAFLGYASRLYRPLPDARRWWKGMYVQAAPPQHPRVGVILPIEGGLWHVTIGGGDRQYPPADEAGFLEFAASLRTPALYEALQAAEPCSPICTTRSTENRRRHFESTRMPAGFIVTGDAACAFNPVYGQGMTTAALGARALGESLDITRARTGHLIGHGFERRFQARLARANRDPWLLAVGEDLRYRATQGASRSLRIRAMHAYMDAVGRMTTHDVIVRARLLRAFHMIAPPASLFTPSVVWRVLTARRRSSERVPPDCGLRSSPEPAILEWP